jgi:hypothetical protein
MDRVQLPNIWTLTWRDFDPAARPAFDPAGVAELVRSLPPAAEVPPAGADWRVTGFWYDRMTAALVERLGDWVVAWWYTIAMEDHQDSGVVPVWRGELPEVTTPAETLTRIAEGVVAWHELLVELATDARGRFAAVAGDSTDDSTGDPPAWRAVQGPGRVTRYPGELHARRLPHPRDLDWAELDPAGREFDPATVPAVVAALVGASGPPAPEADWRLVDLWEEQVTAGLVDRYGQWVVGWRWGIGETDLDGGPVAAWCCLGHSAPTPEAAAASIAASLVEWHGWLAELAERFHRFLPLPAGDLDGWERAVAHLVTAVGDRTRYDSGWYSCCTAALGWFLEAAGVDASRRQELLEHAIGGRFESWTEPPPQVVEAVAGQLARELAVDRP